MPMLVRASQKRRRILASQLEAGQIKVGKPGNGLLDRPARVVSSGVYHFELASFRSIERPTRLGRVNRTKRFDVLGLLKQ